LNNLFITITLLGRTYNHSAYIDVGLIGDLTLEQILTKAALTTEQSVESMCNQEVKSDSHN
jgi:hypothetical protein